MTKKILIVEDEPDIQMIAEIGLKDIGGFEVKIANNGQEALDLLSTWKPDLILSDVMMPIMDGMAMLRKIKQSAEFKHIPVVIMTARSKDEEDFDYIKMGAVDLIIKPFDPLELANQIKKHGLL